MQNQSKPLNHRTLSSYHRYFRSISYEYCIFFNMWPCPSVVCRGCCDRPMSTTHRRKSQLSATRRRFLSWMLFLAVQNNHWMRNSPWMPYCVEAYDGLQKINCYMQFIPIRRVPTSYDNFIWKWTQAGTMFILTAPPL